MPTRVVTLHRWQIAAVFVAVTASFVVGLWLVVHLNNIQQADLQRSRIESCKRTYEGVRQIFQPLLRPKKARTPRMQHDLDTFNRRIDELKADCDRQTSTKGH